MPTISIFYGIQIFMYFKDNVQHHEPHIHVQYQSYKAVFAINDARLIVGNLPNKQIRIIQAWIEIHQDDLLINWSLAIDGKDIFKIEPLR